MNIFHDDHLEIIKELLENQVSFLLIGGYAVIFHGYNRTTGDMDLWLEPTNQNKEKNSLMLLRSWDLNQMTWRNWLKWILQSISHSV